MTTTLTKTRQKTRTQEASQSTVDTVSRGMIGAMGGTSLLIGFYGIVSLFAGLVKAGGPIELAKTWFQAVGWM